MSNTLRLKKGKVFPNQDLLELEISNFIYNSSLGKTYTIEKDEVDSFLKDNKNVFQNYMFHRGDGAYLLDSDYEIIIRKVSKERMENESISRVKKLLNKNV